MPTRFECHRTTRVVAALLLLTALALAWMSVTPTGALSCLHCFLAQRWVEATVAERGPRQSAPKPQPAFSVHAARLVALDPLRLSESAFDDPGQTLVSGDLSPSDVPTAIECHWVFRRQCVVASFHAASSQSLAARDPKSLGLRAPPSPITT